MEKITVFTDGAAKGNPGPGGYGVVMLLGDTVVELGEKKDRTTNNEMELKAVVEALRCVAPKEVPVEIYSDSKYVIDGAKGWIFGWMKNGWKTKAGTDVINKELWMELVDLVKKVEIVWHKVPGHVGIIGNERADTIASDLAEDKKVVLYSGSKDTYDYNIENTDYDKAKAEERSSARKRQSQKAFSYVSKVDGKIETHKIWKECEARVKGKSGVRFKKALSKEEEEVIVSEFSR